MKRLDSIQDDMNGTVTYELNDGRRVCFDARAVREYGIATLMGGIGEPDRVPTERVPVIFHGRRVGTVPGDFDDRNIKSNSWLYDPRPGDFKREGDSWVVGRTVGPGDLEAVAGFVYDPASQPHTHE